MVQHNCFPSLIDPSPPHYSGRGVGPDPAPGPETPSACAEPEPSDPDDPKPALVQKPVEGAVGLDSDT